jgi:hypothetical protein
MAKFGWKSGFRDLGKRMQEYSAQPAFEESVSAARRMYERDMDEGLRDTYARMGAGQRGTGFGFGKILRTRRDMEERFNDQVASRALAAQQLELQARGLEGDVLSGGWDRRTAEKNARRKRRGGLLGALGGVAGTLVGGPLGGYLGGQLGGAIGQYI